MQLGRSLKPLFKQSGVLRSVEIGQSLRSLGNYDDRASALRAQGIASGSIASVPVEERDDRWNALVREN